MSRIYNTIVKLVNNRRLREPFRVADVQAVSSILDRSPSFLSKHAVDNPQGYTEYFRRVNNTPGLYRLVH
jgi:hypothetical protein